VIVVQGLSKSFGTTEAVSGLSFRVAPGEVVGFLGRNGAGKTTTMRVLTGFFAPTAGRVEVAGFDVFEQPLEVKARTGYLPESPPLYQDMVVASYLRFCARLRGVPRSRLDGAIERVVGRCGLTEVAGRVVGNLSRGYRQRVGIAQALVHDPEVLVLDEPTTALDPGQIREIRSLINDLAGGEGGERRTIILSTHRLEDVEATCSRVVILARGRLACDESLADLTREQGLEERFLELTADPATPGGPETGR
jgi:ABC-2 type transport system ATP-binding protein